jgi:hypothetical protein
MPPKAAFPSPGEKRSALRAAVIEYLHKLQFVGLASRPVLRYTKEKPRK